MASQINTESVKKEELQVVVDDLHEQVASLLSEFNAAIIEQTNHNTFTSDEEEMGITPTSYNAIN